MWKVKSSWWQSILFFQRSNATWIRQERKCGVVQVTKQHLNRHSFSEDTQFKMKVLPPAVQIKSGLISDILSPQWSTCHFVILLKSYWLKKSPDRQRNSKNIEKHAKQSEIQKSIKTVERIRRAAMQWSFIKFTHPPADSTDLHSFIHPFIHSLVHFFRLKCCSTSGQSASVRFKPCCLSWRVSIRPKQTKNNQHWNTFTLTWQMLICTNHSNVTHGTQAQVHTFDLEFVFLWPVHTCVRFVTFTITSG